MRSGGDASQPRAGPRSDPDVLRPGVVGSENLLVRNYDHRWGYDLRVEVIDAAGDRVFQTRYYLQAGRVESELDVLPPGSYRIRVTLDNDQRRVRRCRIGSAPEHTAVIEVGNGALSLTEGIVA